MRFWGILFCLISFSVAHARMDLERATCRELFNEAHRRAGAPLKFSDLLLEPARAQSVLYLNSAPGNFSKIWGFHLMGATWYSTASTSGRDMQGDPRMIVLALGHATAAFLGFKLTDKRLWVPDPTEFNARLDLLNEYAVEKTQMRFYELPPETPLVEAELYLQNFLEWRLPVAARGIPQLHDIAYHYLAILLPPRLVQHAQRLTRFILELSYYLENHSNDSSIRQIAYDLRVARSHEIDAGNGNLARLIMLGIAQTNFDLINCIQTDIAEPLIKLGRSPHDVLAGELSREKSTYFPQLKNLSHEKHLIVQRLARAFLDSKLAEREFLQDYNSLAQSSYVTNQQLCKEIQLRRISLIDAQEAFTARAISH